MKTHSNPNLLAAEDSASLYGSSQPNRSRLGQKFICSLDHYLNYLQDKSAHDW